MTLKDIASMTGASISTVSRSLNNSPLVAEKTRERIRRIALKSGIKLGTQPSHQNGTIGIILPDSFDSFHVQLYHRALHNHLRRTLERANHDLIVTFADNRFDGSSNLLRIVRQKKVDGLIIMQPSLEISSEHFLQENNIPYVFSHYPPEKGRPDIDWVYVDHERGGMLAGGLIAEQGYRRVLLLTDTYNAVEFQLRVQGLRQALQLSENKLEIDSLSAETSLDGGGMLVEDNLERIRSCDVIFAVNDLMAIGAIQALQMHGIAVPEDMAVIGYDDIPLAAGLRPQLTTIRQPMEEVAFMTCERLIKMIEDRQNGIYHQPRHISLMPHLVVRGSTATATATGQDDPGGQTP